VRCGQEKMSLTMRGVSMPQRLHDRGRRWECVRRVCPIRRRVRRILWRRWGWWDDAHEIGRGFSVANLLLDFWLCQCDVENSEILWWMERGRTDFVGRMWGWMRGRWAADFAMASMFSFPRMSRCLGTHMKVILTGMEVKVERRVWIRLTRGWVEDVLEMADKEEREFELIRKERECERGRDRIISRHWKMACNSAVRMDSELRWRRENVLSLIE